MRLKRVLFKVDDRPSGELYNRRVHARRQTPYPAQMQALIDADLLTAGAYEVQRDRRGAEYDAIEDALAKALKDLEPDKPHVLRQIWNDFKALFHRA